jgi:hypothetical protein
MRNFPRVTGLCWWLQSTQSPLPGISPSWGRSIVVPVSRHLFSRTKVQCSTPKGGRKNFTIKALHCPWGDLRLGDEGPM